MRSERPRSRGQPFPLDEDAGPWPDDHRPGHRHGELVEVEEVGAVVGRSGGPTDEQAPFPARVAVPAVLRCAVEVFLLLARHRLRLPRRSVGLRLEFADGTSGRVYRETVVAGRVAADPCALVVRFRLRRVTGHGHALFRAESILNTPLFAGFPGFVAKWWLAADEHEVYRGLYEWDGATRAEYYARCLWWILARVSVPGSVGYTVIEGRHRDDLPTIPGTVPPGGEWWRPIGVDTG